MTRSTSLPALSLAAFERAIAVHGSDLARWPQDLRAQAETLVAGNAGARLGLAQAVRLDGLLQARLTGTPTATDSAIAQRVLTRLATRALPAQDRPLAARILPAWLLAWDFTPAWPSIAALAGMAMLGFLLGAHAMPTGVRAYPTAQRVTVADADVSAIVFEPDPLAETGL